MQIKIRIHGCVCAALLLALSACGGGGDASPAPPSTPPLPGTVIGPAGGTVTGPTGVSVVIPAGALTTDVRISITQSASNAPALPTGFSVSGQTFSFTPHGTKFAVPVTMTLPFNPALVPAGGVPTFYKTNAQNQWVQIGNATFGPTSVSAQVNEFSEAGVLLPPLTPAKVLRLWSFRELRGDSLTETEVAQEEEDVDVAIDFEFGRAFLDEPYFVNFDGASALVAPDQIAVGLIGSKDFGKTYWVGAESPLGIAALSTSPIGSKSRLLQYQTFLKNAANATYSFTLTSAFVEAYDANAGRTCPPQHLAVEAFFCDLVGAEVALDVMAYEIDVATGLPKPGPILYRVAGGMRIFGSAPTGDGGGFFIDTMIDGSSREPLWNADAHFTTTTEPFSGGLFATDGEHRKIKLASPVRYNIDLSSVPTGGAFVVRVITHASAYDRAFSGLGNIAEGMTAAHAWLRDPADVGGSTVTTSGLTAIGTPSPIVEPVDPPVAPAACVPGPAPDPAAGVIQFSAANYTQNESSNYSPILVTRTGGAAGAVTATFATGNGSAVSGADYSPMNITVYFANGDAVGRAVSIPMVADTVSGEADKTVNLTLSQPGGCAALGAQTTAVLTIHDDDVPPPPPSFSVGGTVSGLAGTGLVLEDHNRLRVTPGNGAFTFPGLTQTGQPYTVDVVTQPENPLQICTVSNGSGTISNANITDVAVNCVTPAASGALDAGFGGIGKVTTAFGGDETAMVLQPDGKIIMVGGSASDFVLARYNTDGSLDETFGGDGLVTTDIAGGPDAAFGIALQADGKLVVVGQARVNGADDFALVRYDTGGNPDATFGTLGKVTTDFTGQRDRAYAVAITSDNHIVVAGETTLSAQGPVDFAVARYNANGTPDATFGAAGNGRVSTDIAGGVDLPRNVLLQANGAILVSGAITLNGSPVLENAGVARYTAGGLPDNSFDADGKLAIPNLLVGEALALQVDGKILLAGSANAGGAKQFALLRLSGSGAMDGSFGTAGLSTVAFSSQDDFGRGIALQADGKILVSGQSSNRANPDFALARFDTAGVLDASFDTDGKLTVDFFGAGDSAENVAVQADGKIVLGGFAVNGSRVNYGLARVSQ